MATQPEKLRVEHVRLNGRILFARSDLPTFDKNLLRQRDANGFSRTCDLSRTVRPVLDRFDRADLVPWREEDFVTHAKRAGLDSASKDAALIESINVLNRKAQR